MRILPAIDISEGKCVRLTQGDYGKRTVYFEDPVSVALDFQDAGLRYLHVVDLDGAKARKLVNLKVLQKIASKTHLRIDFGGGIQSLEDLTAAFDAGAAQVTLGSIAAHDPALALEWLAKFGPERLILGADAREGMISAGGWTEATTLSVYDFVKDMCAAGFKYVVSTDIARDGMLSGPAVELYKGLLKQNPGIALVASGGIRDLADLDTLAELRMDGAIVGKAIYEGHITPAALAAWKAHH